MHSKSGKQHSPKQPVETYETNSKLLSTSTAESQSISAKLP